MTKKKETLPKGVLAQNEYAEEKKKDEKITQVSLRVDFKVRGLECTSEQIAKSAVDDVLKNFNDIDDSCLWARAQVLEYKKV